MSLTKTFRCNDGGLYYVRESDQTSSGSVSNGRADSRMCLSVSAPDPMCRDTGLTYRKVLRSRLETFDCPWVWETPQ